MHSHLGPCAHMLLDRKTLANFFLYKTTVKASNLHKTYFKLKSHSTRSPMGKFTTLEVSIWINKLNLNFRDALITLVSLVSPSFVKLKWMSPFYMLPLNFGSLLNMFSNSMVWNYAPLLRNLV